MYVSGLVFPQLPGPDVGNSRKPSPKKVCWGGHLKTMTQRGIRAEIKNTHSERVLQMKI